MVAGARMLIMRALLVWPVRAALPTAAVWVANPITVPGWVHRKPVICSSSRIWEGWVAECSACKQVAGPGVGLKQ